MQTRGFFVGERYTLDGDMRTIKIVIEKHEEGFVAYPLGLRGVVVGEGDSFEEALADVKSAVQFHLETFGSEAYEEV